MRMRSVTIGDDQNDLARRIRELGDAERAKPNADQKYIAFCEMRAELFTAPNDADVRDIFSRHGFLEMHAKLAPGITRSGLDANSVLVWKGLIAGSGYRSAREQIENRMRRRKPSRVPR